MRKKIIKCLIILGFTIFINFCLTTNSQATLGISVSKTKVKPGENFDVTVSVSEDEAGEATLSVANGEISQTAIDLMSQTSVTISCTAGTSGTVNIKASGLVANYETETEVEQTAEKSVTIEAEVQENKPEEAPAEPTTPTAPTTSSKSSDATLKSLKIGDWPVTVQDKVDITVDSFYEKLTINAVPKDSKATLSGNGIGAVDLEEGTNNFKIIVKAEDGTTKEYKIIIRRKAETTVPTSPPNVVEEENKAEEKKDEEVEEFGLSNLVITGIKLNPTFDINVFEYTAEFSEDTDILEIITKASSEDATVEVVGNTNLKIGENLITVMVKSADGETTKTYQITVIKNEPEVEAIATANNTLMNTVVIEIENNQGLKNKLGRIGFIAVVAIIAVILLGIIVIINTKKKENNDFEEENIRPKKNKLDKEDFRVAVNEEEAYRELEKLSNLHNRNNILNEEQINFVEDQTEDNMNPNQEMNNRDFSINNNLEDKNLLEQLINDSITEELIIEEEKMHNPYEETKNDFLAGFGNNDKSPNSEFIKSENKKHKKSKGKRFK